MRLLLVLALLSAVPPLFAQDPTDAYADARARDLVRLARARRAVVDTRITGYEVTARERISARLAVAGVERLLFRRETAAHIDWSRDTVRIELLGAREAQPMIRGGVQLPSPGIARSVPSLAFDPADSEMLFRVDSTAVRHPLSTGSEAYYRFRTGDSTSILLPSGRVVRLLELRIAARRASPRLISGSFWLDAETHAVVRVAFRLSRAIRASTNSVVLPEMTAELDHVAIEYGLWDLRWWLPRSLVARGVVRAGGIRLPLAYERSYEEYRVEGDTLIAAALPPEVSGGSPEGRCRRRISWNITMSSEAPSDSAWDEDWRGATADVAEGDTTEAARNKSPLCARAYLVSRAEGADLISSSALPASIYEDGEGVVGQEELKALSELAGRIPAIPWSMTRPRLQLFTPELVRFNRVEGLSLGGRGILPLGPAELRGELRIGTTGEVGARVGGLYSTPALRGEVAVYRTLEAVELAAQPFTLATSASALLLGRDENDYFRGSGIELRLQPAPARRRSWDVRAFAERQEAVRTRSETSLRELVDGGFRARENLRAEPLDQAGVVLRLRAARGDDPTRLRTHAELELHAETGDRTFARPLFRAGMDGLLAGRVGFGTALTFGTGLGLLPAQRLWQIGGATTVRGHDPAALRGESVWLARGELTRGSPMFRPALFGDAGWAGEMTDLQNARPLRGVGLGVSMLDNLLRLDLARGIGGGGYRLHLRLGGPL